MAFEKICFLLVIFACSQINAVSMQIDDTEDDPLDGYDDNNGVTGKDAPCCLPDVWQGSLHSEYGMAKPRKFVASCSQVFVDRTNFRIAGQKHFAGKGNFTFSYIMLFNDSANSSTVYLFDAAKKQCGVKNFQKIHFRQACIPKNATLHGTIALGVAGTSLSVQSWGIHHKRKGEDNTNIDEDKKPKPKPHRRGGFIGNLLVVPGQCIPVMMQDAGSAFGGFIGSTYFHDIETSIKDPSVFTPPDYCKKFSMPLIFGLDNAEDVVPDGLAKFIIEEV